MAESPGALSSGISYFDPDVTDTSAVRVLAAALFWLVAVVCLSRSGDNWSEEP